MSEPHSRQYLESDGMRLLQRGQIASVIGPLTRLPVATVIAASLSISTCVFPIPWTVSLMTIAAKPPITRERQMKKLLPSRAAWPDIENAISAAPTIAIRVPMTQIIKRKLKLGWDILFHLAHN
jgi:hypothetical protein